jgi:tight adherence protein B
MFNDPPIPLLIVLFLAVPLFIEGAYYILSDLLGNASRQKNRRLDLISKSKSAQVVLRKLQRGNDGPISKAAARAIPSLEKLLVESGSMMPISRVIALMTIIALFISATFAFTIAPPMILSALCGVVLGIGGPVVVLQVKRSRRLAKFAAQLPDAIDLMVRGIQVGHPIAAAMSLVAKQMSDPIGTEFGIATDQIAYGRSLNDAFSELAQRVPQDDVRYLVAVVQIQHQSGGSLGEVLQNLGTVIRARFHMFAKIKSVSAEGRMSGIVLGIMPIAIGLIITALRPDYFSGVSNHPMFWPIMGITPIMLISGWVTMWRLVHFKV